MREGVFKGKRDYWSEIWDLTLGTRLLDLGWDGEWDWVSLTFISVSLEYITIIQLFESFISRPLILL